MEHQSIWMRFEEKEDYGLNRRPFCQDQTYNYRKAVSPITASTLHSTTSGHYGWWCATAIEALQLAENAER